MAGVTETGFESDLFVYDTVSNTFTALGRQAGITPRAYLTMAAYGRSLVIFGGWNPGKGTFNEAYMANCGLYTNYASYVNSTLHCNGG